MVLPDHQLIGWHLDAAHHRVAAVPARDAEPQPVVDDLEDDPTDHRDRVVVLTRPWLTPSSSRQTHISRVSPSPM